MTETRQTSERDKGGMGRENKRELSPREPETTSSTRELLNFFEGSDKTRARRVSRLSKGILVLVLGILVVLTLPVGPMGTVGLRATPTLVNGQVGGLTYTLSAVSTQHAHLGLAPQVDANREGGSLGAGPLASGPGNVTWTLCLENGQLLSGNANCPSSNNAPEAVVWDSSNGYLYVTDVGSNNVSVINGVTDAVVATIPVGVNPEGVAYDSGNGYLYVTNYNSDNVSVINGVTDVVVATIPVGVNPEGVAYDSGNGYLYVANLNDANVSVINGVTDTVVGSVTVGGQPWVVAYDSGNGYLYITNTGNGSVSIITNGPALSTYPVTFSESGLPSGTSWSVTLNGSTQLGTGNLIFTEPNGTHSYTVGSVPGYTASPSSGTVTVAGVAVTQSITFTPVTYTVTFTESGLPAGTSWSVTLNGSTKSSTTTTITFQESNGTYSFTVGSVPGYTASPSSGTVTVAGAAVAQPISFTPGTPVTYSVTFTESGLPSGTSWSVTFNGTPQLSTTTSIVFSNYLNGTYIFTVGGVAGYSVTPSSGSVMINGANQTQPVFFTPVTQGKYSVTFSETGLPPGTSWTVILGSVTLYSTGSSITFINEPNGTYTFTVGAVAGYTATPASGSVTINGAPKTVSVTFTQSTAATYAVTFSESGLPSGTSWSVTLSGSSKSGTGSLVFTEPNGSYPFTVGAIAGYTAAPSSGSIPVNGVAVSKSVTFTVLPLGQYSLIFSETGLPTGTNWSVTVGTTTHSSTASTISFNEPNGTYSFTVGAVTGYTANITSGSVTVNGGPVSRSITFTPASPVKYSVTFTESGLPSGTSWSVLFNGTPQPSTTTSIVFSNYLNGTYNFAVVGVPGYTSVPSSGNVTVNGATKTVSVTFSKSSTGTTYAVTFTESGLPVGTSWSVTLNGNTLSSATSTITFQEANGSDTFTVGSVSGYTVSPSSGPVKVNGGPASQSITFTSSSSKGKTNQTTGFLGLPGYDGYIIVGVIVAAVAAGTAILLMRKRTPPQGRDRPSKNIADGAAQQVAVE